MTTVNLCSPGSWNQGTSKKWMAILFQALVIITFINTVSTKAHTQTWNANSITHSIGHYTQNLIYDDI
jgi:hypothetical protein